MSKKKRKTKPSPPHYFWLDVDNCWFCKKKNGCGNCKAAKRVVAAQKKQQCKGGPIDYADI